jgi:hypothetical protein
VPIKDYPYFVFAVEYITRHDTCYKIPELQQPYATLKAAVEDENSTPAILKTAFDRFRKKVKLCPYLIAPDTERVLSEVQKPILEVTRVDVKEPNPIASSKVNRLKGFREPPNSQFKQPVVFQVEKKRRILGEIIRHLDCSNKVGDRIQTKKARENAATQVDRDLLSVRPTVHRGRAQTPGSLFAFPISKHLLHR